MNDETKLTEAEIEAINTAESNLGEILLLSQNYKAATQTTVWCIHELVKDVEKALARVARGDYRHRLEAQVEEE